MPQTIDYKVNVDLNEAMSTLQMVDMQMSQLGGGGGGYAPGGYGQISHTEQAFGDLSFSAGQFVQRFQAPLGTIRTHTPASLSTMPNINLATAATAVWAPGGLSVPHGIARYDFERYAKEQFSIQGSRAIAGGVWGASKEAMALGAGAAGAAIGSVIPGLGTLVGGGIGMIAGYMGADAVLSPVTGMMQDRALLEDVARSSSKMTAGGARQAARGITKMHLDDPMISGADATMIAGLGAQFGLMGDSASTSKEYLQNFRKLTKDAKEVATALGTSLQEGMATMAQLKGVGFGVGQIGGVVSQLSGMAGGDPSKIQGLIGTGMMGASAFHGTGMARTGGFWQAIGTAGAVSSAKAGGDVSGEMWTQAGGTAGVTRLMLGSNMQFHESGMGVAMQAGLWQGGTKMGGYAGGDTFGLMASGMGGMGSGDWLSFNRNRAEAVGGMSESARRQMEAKAQMEVAGMWADSLGGSTEDALFAMAQGRGMSTPQAQTWASAIQRQARGGGGGGPSRRSQLRARLVDQSNRRNERLGIDAMIGEFRNDVAGVYENAFVEPVSSISGVVEGWISDYAETKMPATASVDLILMSVDGELRDKVGSLKGMDISKYDYAASFAGTMRKAGKKSRAQGGVGWVKTGEEEFFLYSDVYEVTDAAEKAGRVAWGTSVADVRNGRAGDASRVYEQMARASASSRELRGRVSRALREDGYGTALGHLGVDLSDATQLTAGRAVLETQYGREATQDELEGLETHSQMGAAVTTAQDLSRSDRMRILGLETTYNDRFNAQMNDAMRVTHDKQGIVQAEGSMTAWLSEKAFRNKSYAQSAYEWAGGGKKGAAMGVVGAVFGDVIWRGATGVTSGGTGIGMMGSSMVSAIKDTDIDEEDYKAYGKDIVQFIGEAVDVTRDERSAAIKDSMTARPGSSFVPVSEEAAYSIADQTSREWSRTTALAGLQRSLAGDPNMERIMGKYQKMSWDELKKVADDLSVHVEQDLGGPGKKASGGKAKTIVPIAMGIDATDRDLYNAVSSLYRSVQALEGKIKTVPAKPKPVGHNSVLLDAD